MGNTVIRWITVKQASSFSSKSDTFLKHASAESHFAEPNQIEVSDGKTKEGSLCRMLW
jgi:hypothetical protein